MRKYKRIFTIVVDSLGAGALPDAAAYGDAGTDTLGHISQSVETFQIPNLQKLGLANLHPLKQVDAVERPLGYYTYLHEARFFSINFNRTTYSNRMDSEADMRF